MKPGQLLTYLINSFHLIVSSDLNLILESFLNLEASTSMPSFAFSYGLMLYGIVLEISSWELCYYVKNSQDNFFSRSSALVTSILNYML